MIRDLSKEGKFGRLQPLERLPRCKGGNVYYKCLCDCGNITFVAHGGLTMGTTKSCGCIRKEMLSRRTSTHRHSKEKLYLVWKTMKKRCFCETDKHYKWYGAKGVKVCEEWKTDYMSFRNWAYENGYKDTVGYTNYTIDRIDPYGNYEPSNCRIADWVTQRHNRRA